jgi:hypothetical protein
MDKFGEEINTVNAVFSAKKQGILAGNENHTIGLMSLGLIKYINS